MIVLALIYSFCFEDAVSLSIPIKDAIFVKLRCIIAVLQGLKVEQFPVHLLLAATAPPPRWRRKLLGKVYCDIERTIVNKDGINA